MPDVNQEMLSFLIVFPKNMNVTGLKTVTHLRDTFNIVVLFLYHIVLLFLGQHLCSYDAR